MQLGNTLCLTLGLILVSSCSTLDINPEPVSAISSAVSANSSANKPQICRAWDFSVSDGETERPWSVLFDSDTEVERLWKQLDQHYSAPLDGQQSTGEGRSLLVFIDGTNNTKESNTNIWKLYTLATQHACDGHPVIPYYRQGVGAGFGSRFLGSLAGLGASERIRDTYEFLVDAYQPNDKIFVFGFSRGAYIARSLNGFVEFAGLLKADNVDRSVRAQIKKLYGLYNVNNDGQPGFEAYLYGNIAEAEQNSKRQYETYSCSSGRGEEPPVFCDEDDEEQKVKVLAIGVFDTVPALGLSRDDNPDNHRTNLFAYNGYHAMAIDEQRNDFRPLRFDDRIRPEQELEELWFAGAHGDVGGGYKDSTGLELVSRRWMLEKFKQFDLFADDPNKGLESCTDKKKERDPCPPVLENGEEHDELLDKPWLFGRLGIHWRKPAINDKIHCSVLKRWQLDPLPNESLFKVPPESKERYSPEYRPENMYDLDAIEGPPYEGPPYEVICE